MATAQTSDDKRGDARKTTLKGARIAFNAGRSTFSCTVRNMSSKGAKLQVASVIGIPETFDLLLGDGSRKPCRVVWRSG